MLNPDFCAEVVRRDGAACVVCGAPSTRVHAILAAELWDAESFSLNNGATVCDEHAQQCLSTVISVEEIRRAARILSPALPDHLYAIQAYDTWGNPVLRDGRRAKGELFHEAYVQQWLQLGGALSLFSDWVRYPRTFVLPWSEHCGEGDVRLSNLQPLHGRQIVVTEKMDGENISLYRDYFHSRGLETAEHSSREWLKAFWQSIRELIPPGWRVCGEYLFARHTISYSNLDSFFLGFAVWDNSNNCLGWDETVEYLRSLGISHARVLYRGEFDELALRALWGRTCGTNSEGYVLRADSAFAYKDFRRLVGKFVRQGYQQTYPISDSARTGSEVVQNHLTTS